METIRQAKSINKVVLLDGEQVHARVDAHKHTYHVSLWSQSRELLSTF